MDDNELEDWASEIYRAVEFVWWNPEHDINAPGAYDDATVRVMKAFLAAWEASK